MSAMKHLLMQRLDVDLTELGTQAANAALLDTSAERLKALTAVFEECGERASTYDSPHSTVEQLVRWVAMDFQISRKNAREMEYANA
ncbi:hypothetical protein ACFYY2_12140 [Streptomyces sp. NPDC001822]|uniref:hypothetical protein n=1 Tax=Streptomyces sp. NPDC001822 TaxID=3364614 RepID=UPI00369B27D7